MAPGEKVLGTCMPSAEREPHGHGEAKGRHLN